MKRPVQFLAAISLAVAGLTMAATPAPAVAQGAAELGIIDGWTLRQSSGVCSLGSWDGPRGPLLMGFRENPNEVMASMWFGYGLFDVANGAKGDLVLTEGKPITGQFEVKTDAQRMTVFRAMVPLAAIPQNDAGDRVFEYSLKSSGSILDENSFTVSARAWTEWRKCLGES